jgi:RimJ/RimL family protein N-acetyltransferase
MRHVGFPDGLGITMEELEASWKKWKDDPLGLMKIICLKSKMVSESKCVTAAIGETNFHDYRSDNKQVEIGIKICRPDLWGQGYGTEALAAMTRYAFEALGVDRVLLNPSKANARIIHVNEKCGYRIIGEKDDGLLMELKRRGWQTWKTSLPPP